MFRFGFKFKPERFLGIDIGTSCIKIIEIGKNNEERTLENYGEVSTLVTEGKPFRDYRKEEPLLSTRSMAEIIKDVCKESGIQAEYANFSIPDFCTFFTSVKMPIMSKDEISEAIKYEIRPSIPLPLSEITLDWAVIEGKISKTPLKILAVAIPTDIVNQYREIANLSGLKLKILEPEAFALTRALIKKEEKEMIGLVDIGERSTTCNIVGNGILKISHSFNIASNELTERLARSLNIKYNEAEELKKTYGLNVIDNGSKDASRNVRRILIPSIDLILEEIKKAFRTFYKEEGEEITKVVLTGGSAFLPGLKEYFSTELKKPVIISNPFDKLSCPPVLQKVLAKKGSSYAVAVGLALKGLE